MVYKMVYYVDGGCRRNGQDDPYGAAAAVEKSRSGKTYKCWTKRLDEDYGEPTPTNQRAEITAIIIALELALEKWQNLHNCPRIDLTVYSDSRYATDCMREWIYKWSNNGWMNARGNPVKNLDLIMRASDLDEELQNLGWVRYEWRPREQNQLADRACNKELDAMADEKDGQGYGYDSHDSHR